MPIILATQNTDIRRIEVQSQYCQRDRERERERERNNGAQLPSFERHASRCSRTAWCGTAVVKGSGLRR
jgi:hypothetical protein